MLILSTPPQTPAPSLCQFLPQVNPKLQQHCIRYYPKYHPNCIDTSTVHNFTSSTHLHKLQQHCNRFYLKHPPHTHKHQWHHYLLLSPIIPKVPPELQQYCTRIYSIHPTPNSSGTTIPNFTSSAHPLPPPPHKKSPAALYPIVPQVPHSISSISTIQFYIKCIPPPPTKLQWHHYYCTQFTLNTPLQWHH